MRWHSISPVPPKEQNTIVKTQLMHGDGRHTIENTPLITSGASVPLLQFRDPKSHFSSRSSANLTIVIRMKERLRIVVPTPFFS